MQLEEILRQIMRFIILSTLQSVHCMEFPFLLDNVVSAHSDPVKAPHLEVDNGISIFVQIIR